MSDLPQERFDPALRPFLPMLYVAWADGELTDSEISSICTQLSAVEGLDQSCQSALGRWLDPNNPPSSTDLVSLLAQIRRSASSLSNEERRSLTDLGVEIARLEGVDVSFSVLQALNDLEVTLGLEGGEAVRQLLAPMRPYEPPIEPEHRFDIESMTALLDGDQMQIRRQVRNLISQPGFEYLYGLGSSEYRQVVLQRVKSLADSGIGALSYPVEFGGSGDMAAFIAAFETAAFGDLSVLIKFGVQFGLFGGSILQLGTDHHHESYLPRVGSLDHVDGEKADGVDGGLMILRWILWHRRLGTVGQSIVILDDRSKGRFGHWSVAGTGRWG